MAEAVEDKLPVCVGSISLSAAADGAVHQCDDTQDAISADFSAEELYKHALQFYKDNEGTSMVTLSYSDRLRLSALTKQVSHGRYSADVAPDVGLLDVFGNDQRQMWQSLDDMNKDEAMSQFVHCLSVACPQFTTHIAALQQHRNDLLSKQLAEAREAEEAELQRKLEAEDEERRRREVEERQKQQQQEQEFQQCIRAALVQQTEIQFRQYAKQQFPDSVQQQDELVSQLQDQHYEQYMQHVQSQLEIHQRQQITQIQAQRHRHGDHPVEIPSPGNEQTEFVDVAVETGGHHDDAVAVVNGSSDAAATTLLSASVNDEFQPQQQEEEQHHDQDHEDKAEGNETDDEYSSAGEDDSDLPALIPAILWTRKDIREFKDSLRKNSENVLRISSLSMATVRVPTHASGRSIFWEFASDSYDVGFGVYFEWNVDPPTRVTVQMSESSDEDDDLDDEYAEGGAGETGAAGKAGDVERGSRSRKDTGPPCDEIIQIYRRDSHEDVYCGSHTYPGRGVYLLKFDNSYSLWRSKTVYYRVFYSK